MTLKHKIRENITPIGDGNSRILSETILKYISDP